MEKWYPAGWASPIPPAILSRLALLPTGFLSKSITAVGVMQLVEQGKLNLDDPLKHLPWFDVAGGQGGDITVAPAVPDQWFSELAGQQANLAPDYPAILAGGTEGCGINVQSGELPYSNLNYSVLGL
jgi:hypothetical protein